MRSECRWTVPHGPARPCNLRSNLQLVHDGVFEETKATNAVPHVCENQSYVAVMLDQALELEVSGLASNIIRVFP